ncbi:MAG: response regulator [Polyangiaceae bacterium]|jgi:CheY-like chemotaxis protein
MDDLAIRRSTVDGAETMGEEAPLVLVVESEARLRSDYCNWLAEEGYRVFVAANGLEALELTRMHQPLLVLMNLDLPGLDGWEATRVLRRDPWLREIHVVALTGSAAKTRDCDGRSAGCDAVLRTPIRRQALIDTVCRFVPNSIPESIVRVKVVPGPQGQAMHPSFTLRRKRA